MLTRLQALPFFLRALLVIALPLTLSGCLSPSFDADSGSTSSSNGSETSGQQGSGRQPTSNEEDEIEILDVPETGVNLGWGWNS